MSTIARSKVWVTGDLLTASDLNGEFNTIINDYNGSIDQNNIGTITGTVTFSVSSDVDLLDLTKTGTGAGGIFDIADAGTGTSLDISKTGDGKVLNLVADSLTTTTLATISSNASSTGTRSILDLINDNTAATGTTLLRLQQDSTGAALEVSS